MNDVDRIALIIRGGSGKSLMATVVVRNLRKAHADLPITVVTAFPEVFRNNPHVSRILTFKNPANFYDDHIRDARTKIISYDPYLSADYIYKDKHILDVWCELAGVPCDSHKPDIFLSGDELREGEALLNEANRPVLLMQITGGNNPKSSDPKAQREAEKKMFRRNLPVAVAQEVVNQLRNTYAIYLTKAPNQPDLEGARSLSLPLRQCYALIPFAQKLLLIDSFMQHAARALDKQATVVWGGTSPKVLGYEEHTNLVHSVCPQPFCHRPNTFLFDNDIEDRLWECPYDERCMEFDPDELVKAVGQPDQEVSTRLLLDVFGIKRAGNHAVITWILANSPGLSAHYNLAPANCVLKWRQGDPRPPVDGSRRLDTQFPPLSREDVAKQTELGSIVVSREDTFLPDGWSTTGLARFGKIKREVPILILRDAFNHLASIYKRYVVDDQGGKNWELTWPQYVAAWKQYAREFLGRTSYLGNGDVMKINYNRWFTDDAYRRELAATLGLVASDRGLGEISRWGSSFGDVGDAREMAVQDRWRTLKDDSKFRAVFDDSELVALSDAIFGELPGVKEWLDGTH